MGVEVVTAKIGDAPISFETGKLAKQANGSVLVRSGDTVILVTAVGAQSPRPGADFFPLTVDVEERMYAAGKIPGGFIKRESRPSDRATLTYRFNRHGDILPVTGILEAAGYLAGPFVLTENFHDASVSRHS